METTRKAEKNILIAFLLNLCFAVIGVCVNGCAAIFTHGSRDIITTITVIENTEKQYGQGTASHRICDYFK